MVLVGVDGVELVVKIGLVVKDIADPLLTGFGQVKMFVTVMMTMTVMITMTMQVITTICHLPSP